MKALSIAAGIILTSLVSCAQKVKEKDVPENVKMSLQKAHPEAKKVTWEKEDANYEAGFETKDGEYSIVIDGAGNILETEVEIAAAALPETTKAYIAKQYSGEKIKEAARITDAKGIVTYEAEVKGKDLIFDSAGNFVTILTKKD